MHCEKYLTGACRSCQWLELTPEQQIAAKQGQLQALLPEIEAIKFQPPSLAYKSLFVIKRKWWLVGVLKGQFSGLSEKMGSVST